MYSLNAILKPLLCTIFYNTVNGTVADVCLTACAVWNQTCNYTWPQSVAKIQQSI